MSPCPIGERLRAVCLALPEASEELMRRGPSYRVADKIFALERPRDGGLALWCKVPAGSREFMLAAEPARFFIPPYFGAKGWIGIGLDEAADWREIEAVVRRSYRLVAPKRLAKLEPCREVSQPDCKPRALYSSVGSKWLSQGNAVMPHTAPVRHPQVGVPVSGIDPFSLDFLRDPHPAHEALREAGPIVWLEKYGAYAAARHAEVRQILSDPATFCSSRGVGLSDFQREKPWRPPSLVLERDPPEHDRARAVLNRALSATVMRSLRGRFAAAADGLAHELERRVRFDAMADCAEVYPMMVLPDAIGLSRQGREHLLPYAATVFNMFGPDNELRRAALAQMKPHVEWIAAQCKREALADDGIGAAIHAGADAGEVTRQEAELLVRSLLSAGFDTTVHGLGAAIRQLALNPGEYAALRADPTKARAAFEEALRLETPVQTFFRTTTREVEIGGATIAEGEKVLMLLGAANRDPRKWPDPDRYDIGRPTAGHVAFGAGVHMCVGQLLARLEGETLLGAFARAFKRIEPDGEPTPLFNNTLRGWTRLPVRVTPA